MLKYHCVVAPAAVILRTDAAGLYTKRSTNGVWQQRLSLDMCFTIAATIHSLKQHWRWRRRRGQQHRRRQRWRREQWQRWRRRRWRHEQMNKIWNLMVAPSSWTIMMMWKQSRPWENTFLAGHRICLFWQLEELSSLPPACPGSHYVCCVGLAPAAAVAGTALGHHGTYKAQVRAAMLKEGHIELIKSTTILLASKARSN